MFYIYCLLFTLLSIGICFTISFWLGILALVFYVCAWFVILVAHLTDY